MPPATTSPWPARPPRPSTEPTRAIEHRSATGPRRLTGGQDVDRDLSCGHERRQRPRLRAGRQAAGRRRPQGRRRGHLRGRQRPRARLGPFPEGYGRPRPPAAQKDVERRAHAAGAAHPGPRHFFGLALAGPTIVTNGDEAIKQRLLRRAFTGEDAWCQLFSEPGAGSDLAGLATKAVRDGDKWVIRARRWNTLAHIADRGMLAARTDPEAPKHKGLTYFALDMHAPGVEVRPLRQITGEAEFNEVYMTEVRVPDADRIGDVGEGWRVSMTTLMNERTSIGGGGAGVPPRGSGAIAEAVRLWNEEVGDKTPAARDRLAELWIEAEALRLTNITGQGRPACRQPRARGVDRQAQVRRGEHGDLRAVRRPARRPGARWLRLRDAAGGEPGPHGPPGSSRKMFLRARANSIEAWTSEIQRNILGERCSACRASPRRQGRALSQSRGSSAAGGACRG